MNRADAVLIAEDLVSELVPLCEKIEIAGSIRRERENVNDIDLVLIPKPYQLNNVRQRLWTLYGGRRPEANGDKVIRLKFYKKRPADQPIQVDIYIADQASWGTLLLIRTGSRQHNEKLCGIARERGLILHADGSGIEWISKKVTVACQTEQAIFERLGLAYKEPREREA